MFLFYLFWTFVLILVGGMVWICVDPRIEFCAEFTETEIKEELKWRFGGE